MQQYMIQIVGHLEKKGYKKLNPESNNVYGRTDGDTVYVVVIGSATGLNSEILLRFNSKIIFDISNDTRMNIKLLNILLTENGMFDEPIQDIINKVENVWIFSEDYGKLYVYENQPADFDGLYELIDQNTAVGQEEYKTRIKRLFGIATPILVLINVVLYIISAMNYDEYGYSFILTNLASNYVDVVNKHQYYRLFTSMFVHFSLTHIFSNMIILVALGARIENIIGKVGLVTSYIITGFAASLASLFLNLSDSPFSYAAGASGAICGLMGIMIILAVFNKGRVSDLSLWNIMILSILTILNGYVSGENIDNFAHLGGLVAGLVLGLIIVLINQKVVNRGKT